MARPPTFAELADREATWREIDRLVDEVAELGRSAAAPGQFASGLLERTVRALAALGGAVWTVGPDGCLVLTYQLGLSPDVGPSGGADLALHSRLAERAARSGRLEWVPPGSDCAAGGSASASGGVQIANPTPHLLLLCPVRVMDQTMAVVEIVQRPGASPSTQRGYVSLLAAICEQASEYYGDRQIREARRRELFWSRLDAFCQRIHESLDLDRTAYRVVNEARRLTGCDRVSLVLQRGRRWRTLAISGVERLDRRADAVRRLERLAGRAAASAEPLWYDEQHEAPLGEWGPYLREYLDASPARFLGVIPLLDGGDGGSDDQERVPGAMVFERFEAGGAEPLREAADALGPHAALALSHALAYHHVFFPALFSGFIRQLQLRPLAKAACAVLAGATLVGALAVVPADFRIEVPGQLQPRVRHDLFAPSDGVVSELAVTDAEPVRAGQVAVVLRNTALDLELQQAEGEMETVEKQMAAVQAARLGDLPEDAQTRLRYHGLSAQEEELRQRIAGLKREMEILEKQQRALSVRSPIDGQVVTWQLERRLHSRPVVRGQVLLTVADLQGPWMLELAVPDRRIGHVLQAQQQSQRPLEVTYLLAADPERVRSGHLEKVAARADVDDSGSASVRVTVDIDRQQLPQIRPGATAVAKIHCGRRPIGYVWLHDLYYAMRRWLLF